MIWVFTGISLLFMVIAFMITENNAKYLLAGYNTMPAREREKVDIKSYIPFFRHFHLFLGGSLLVIGLLLNWLIGEKEAGIFLSTYPIAAYIYFIWKSKYYYKQSSWKANKIAAFTLAIVLLGVLLLMYFGFKEDRLLLKETGIEIQGIYGEAVPGDEIQQIELVNELPEISLKTNGFAFGNTYKGYFKIEKDGVVKLILNEKESPYLLITKKAGNKIYYSSGELNERELYEQAMKWLGTSD